jgi:hypothetical protein
MHGTLNLKEKNNIFLCSVTFLEYRAVYELMWKKILELQATHAQSMLDA